MYSPNLDMPPKSKVRKCGADVTKHLVKLMKEACKNLALQDLVWVVTGRIRGWRQPSRCSHSMIGP